MEKLVEIAIYKSMTQQRSLSVFYSFDRLNEVEIHGRLHCYFNTLHLVKIVHNEILRMNEKIKEDN